jgi:hypothetical protein
MAKRVYHYDLTPRDIAAIFMQKDWKYGNTPVATLPGNIQQLIEKCVGNLVASGGGYTDVGRIIVWKDPEFPGGYEIALKVGYVKTNVPDDLDVVA